MGDIGNCAIKVILPAMEGTIKRFHIAAITTAQYVTPVTTNIEKPAHLALFIDYKYQALFTQRMCDVVTRAA